MVPPITSNVASSPNRLEDIVTNSTSAGRRRNPPGSPDPEAEVIALSPTILLATNILTCEVFNKGFQSQKNLQFPRRGQNLLWKHKNTQNYKTEASKKKVYVCHESSSCSHHHPSRAFRGLNVIKKHFWRMHGDMICKCNKCPRAYAVRSNWKSHSKQCRMRVTLQL